MSVTRHAILLAFAETAPKHCLQLRNTRFTEQGQQEDYLVMDQPTRPA